MILHRAADLIELAAAHAPTAAVAREMRSQGAMVWRIRKGSLGLDGWIVQARSGRMVGVWADEKNFRFRFDWPAALPPGAEQIRGEML